MFLISIELIMIKLNNPITYLNCSDDQSESYSSTGIVDTDSSLDVGGSWCSSVLELIFVRFSDTVANLTVSSALHFEDLGVSTFPFLVMLRLCKLLQAVGRCIPHKLHPSIDGDPIFLEHQWHVLVFFTLVSGVPFGGGSAIHSG